MPEKRVTKPKAKAKAAAAAAGAAPFAADDVKNANILGISVEESVIISGMTTALEGARLVGKDVSEIAQVYSKTNTEAGIVLTATPTGLSVSLAITNIKGYVSINWGDGKGNEQNQIASTSPVVHVYAKAGTYTISANTMGSSKKVSTGAIS